MALGQCDHTPTPTFHDLSMLKTLSRFRGFSMMKNFATMFFALLLFWATLESDGKRITLEDHLLGAIAKDVSAKEGAAATERREDDSDVALVASLYRTDSRHHFYDHIP
ncbi:hypothetical protein V6N12_038485 [Hibiscus sabdariffa]|uniref:Uncharacterized protein n=1 Tax=Hibiscus sabdariffa TaxID=183260 RepID=A0ABR1ZFH6_9ROSI